MGRVRPALYADSVLSNRNYELRGAVVARPGGQPAGVVDRGGRKVADNTDMNEENQ